MSNGIESVTTAVLTLALDAASLSQQAIASNIANHATEGYVPLKVDFATQMEEARRSLELSGTIDASTLGSVRLKVSRVTDSMGTGAPVNLDVEMAALADNATRYQALVRVLGRHYAILSTAIADGKR